jgi:primosomal protein N' (replication factor Y)
VRFAHVAIPVPLGQAFTYEVPLALEPRVQPGSRVLCEFGSRNVLGVVVDVGQGDPDIPVDKLKPIQAVVDPDPVVSEELLAFLLELARYYLAPVGEVMRLALPAVERSAASTLGQQGFELGRAQAVGRLVQVARVTEQAEPAGKLRGQAVRVLEQLREAGPTAVAQLEARWGNARPALKRLAQLGLVTVERTQLDHDPFLSRVERDTPPVLTPAQQQAVDAIVHNLEGGRPRAFLLHGVTASGKTEVYLRAVQRCLELAGGAIVLVPEIALTPQLVSWFRARVGNEIAVLHSGLTDRDRHSMWKRLRRGELRVAVGARSALFAPVRGLRLVCVDEEHDGSFKQEEGVRYHARDMALLRAHRCGAVCVLGTATPALETELLARAGKLERLELPERAREATALPRVEVIDLRRVGPGPSGHRLISIALHRALEQVLQAKEQAILFLNRRGFAPSVLCDGCGHLFRCPNCAVGLTLHRAAGVELRCHYCGHAGPLASLCPECGSNRISQEGAGTERIEQALARSFPAARIARLDRDVAAGAKSAPVLERMRRHEVDILVGTQMVTKGHDLPAVTLVGVLNADAALSMPDFRAAERTFQLLVQVAGRAGRGGSPGTVMIQTRIPEHPAVKLAAAHDVKSFVEQELRDRRELGYPPFSRLALVRIDAAQERRGRAEAERLARVARRTAAAGVRVLGPCAAPLARLRNRYRFHFLVQATQRPPLRAALLAVARAGSDRRVRAVIDVDPMNML